MKKQYVSESPEWIRFYWAVMAIAAWVILSCLFSCDKVEIELMSEVVAETPVKQHINWMWVLSYWYFACGAVACWAFYRFITYPKAK